MVAETFQFEKALRELEEIASYFESGEADLDRGLAKFERGMELVAALKGHLGEVENRVEQIKRKFSASGSQSPAAPEPPAGAGADNLFE